jgi:hypothetical protein
MNHKIKNTKSANSLLPLGAAVGALFAITLVVWFSQGFHLNKPEKVDPLKAEQQRIDTMLNQINSDIAKVKQMNLKKPTALATTTNQ